MSKSFGWLLAAPLLVVAAGCESIAGPADLEPRFFASLEGAVAGEYTGSGHFYSGSVPRRPVGIGPQLFTIESRGIGESRRILIQLTRTDLSLPEPGVYPLGHGDGVFRAQLSFLSRGGGMLESYFADGGELIITASADDALEGTIVFSGVRRCQSFNGGGSGYCSAVAAPDAPRIEVSGHFSALRGR